MEGVRIDAGYSEGLQVTPFYDPMIAKCIIFAADRDSCILKAKEFLLKTSIEGIKTNIPYLIQVLDEYNFQCGQYTTELVHEMRA